MATVGTVLESYARSSDRLTAEGAPFAVDRAVIGGHRVKIYADTDENVADILRRAESRFADLDFAIEDGRRLSYADIFGASRRFAAWLQDHQGIKAGDRIGIAMRNRPEWFIAFAAVLRIGAVAVLFNSRGAGGELAAAAQDVPCALILADDERAERMRESGIAAPIETLGPIEAACAPGGREADPVRVDRDAPASILFTSGTTGRPKGAVLTQRNITSMVRNLDYITALQIELAAEGLGVTPDTLRTMMPRISNLLVFPLFHISGITAFFMAITAGGQLVTIRRWNPAVALDLIEAHKITTLSGPPLILGDLLDQPDAAARLTSVNNIGVGGQATPRNLVDRVREALPRASQSSGWGMTEVSGSVTAISGAPYMAKPASSGTCSPIVDLRVTDEEGRELPAGSTGEIWVRGAIVMQGYFNAPEANASAFDGAWLRTGDVGYLDPDGFLHLVDRKKDMVICAGENIYCAEVERVLSADPDFVEVALFGVPDDRLGERAIAAITLREGAGRSEADVRTFARQHLADYKVPAAIAFDLGAFPRNVTGKVNKAQLRARYLEKIGEPA
jgi:acyl-CoA synthetase (AMP-forming)/AMP-acid ligase II